MYIDKEINIVNFFYNYQQDFLEDLDINEKNDLTYSKYESVTTFFIDYISIKKPFTRIDEIDHKALHQFIKFRENNTPRLNNKTKGFEYSTKISYKTILKIFFNFIEDESDYKYTFNIKWKRLTFKKDIKEKKHISDNNIRITLNYLKKLLEKALRVPDINKLNHKAKKEIKSLEYVFMLNFTYKLGLYLGLRASEICTLKIEDISKPFKTKSNDTLVDVLVQGKGSKQRTLPIVYKSIKKEYIYFYKIRKKNDYIFRQISGSRLTRISLYNYFKEVGNFAKTYEKGVHSLRHTASFRMSEQNIDIADAQDMLGHSDISTTRIYFKKNPNRLRNVALKMIEN